MLSKILKEFREADGPVDLNEVSRRLRIERSALEGMIETLLHQGKLKEVRPEDCAHCEKGSNCDHRPDSITMGKYYELVEGDNYSPPQKG